MPQELALLCLVFTSVAVTVGTAMSLLVARWTPERRRLLEATRGAPVASPGTTLIEPRYIAFHWMARVRPRSPAQMAKLRTRLVAAGYRAEAVQVFAAIEVGCAAMGGIAPLIIVGTMGMPLGFAGIAAGLLMPRIVLTRRIDRRQRALRNGLPDALDLLLVCLEAGCTLTQGIGKVSEELRVAHPELAHEFSTVKAEIQAGKPKAEAFQRLAERTQLDDIRPLVTLLVQAERFGTGIGQALRTYAETSRDKRRQRAEEQASKAGIKMVFPLALCIFPAFYIVVLGPAVIHFVRVLFQGGLLAP